MTEDGKQSEPPAPEVEIKRRGRKPLWLFVPRLDVGWDLFRCDGVDAVRKKLADMGIDATDKRLEGVKVLRGEEVPMKVEKQIVLKFGAKAEGD